MVVVEKPQIYPPAPAKQREGHPNHRVTFDATQRTWDHGLRRLALHRAWGADHEVSWSGAKYETLAGDQ